MSFARALNQPTMFIPISDWSGFVCRHYLLFLLPIALAMSGAREVQKKDAPELYRIVENLAIAGGLPTPKVYIIDDPSPNAFATGRDPQHANCGCHFRHPPITRKD